MDFLTIETCTKGLILLEHLRVIFLNWTRLVRKSEKFLAIKNERMDTLSVLNNYILGSQIKTIK